ncbi:MAG: hypothetical protein PHZ23_15930 [Acidiphilium sp.]|nr:hypothetical protein [Acidiphilium sp.]
MPDYAALKAYIAAQPSGTTDATIIAAVNAATISVAVSVPTQAIAAYLGENNLLAGFLGWAASSPTGASAASQVAAKSLAFAFENVTLLPAFDMANTAVAANMQADLAALVSPGSGVSGPIGAADQMNILAMASALTSQALEWGFPNGIVDADIIAARNMA